MDAKYYNAKLDVTVKCDGGAQDKAAARYLIERGMCIVSSKIVEVTEVVDEVEEHREVSEHNLMHKLNEWESLDIQDFIKERILPLITDEELDALLTSQGR